MFTAVNAVEWIRSTRVFGFFSERLPIINGAADSAKDVAGQLDVKLVALSKQAIKKSEEALSVGKEKVAEISQRANATQQVATEKANSAFSYMRALVTGALLTIVLYMEQLSPTLKSYTEGDSVLTRYAVLVSLVLMLVYVLDTAAQMIRSFIKKAAPVDNKKRN
jgi:hypothetical protein